jgi:hypothetical protein
MNSKPIEEGCIARVVSRRANDGLIVTVGKCIGVGAKIPNSYGAFLPDIGPVWEIDQPISWTNQTNTKEEFVPYCPEKKLIRVNDDFGEKG